MKKPANRSLWFALAIGAGIAASCSLRDLDRYSLDTLTEQAGAGGADEAGSGDPWPAEAGPDTQPEALPLDAEGGSTPGDAFDADSADAAAEDGGVPACPPRGAPVCGNPILSIGAFGFSENVCDSLPQSVEGWAQAWCQGQFNYVCPAGYTRTFCVEDPKIPSHNGCSVCRMVRVVCECLPPSADDAGDAAGE
jgi:hypothetical protein